MQIPVRHVVTQMMINQHIIIVNGRKIYPVLINEKTGAKINPAFIHQTVFPPVHELTGGRIVAQTNETKVINARVQVVLFVGSFPVGSG